MNTASTFLLANRLIQPLGTKKLFSMYEHRARPTNGSDCGSLRSHNLTLFVRCSLRQQEQITNI